MRLEERVIKAQHDNTERENLLTEYKNFISSVTYSALGRYVSNQDDEFSVAMIAFNEAITKYDQSKGQFLSLAGIIIKNRLIDYQRKEKRESNVYTFSSLSKTDNDGEEKEFDIEDTKPVVSDSRLEIEALSLELKSYNISFFELAGDSPKAKKTKLSCFKIINFITNNPILINEIKQKGTVPVKAITEKLNIPRKIVERHRKYIITAVIVLTGDYSIIAEYFKDVREVL